MRKDVVRNRALLLEAAREVFADRGLDGSLDDIARRAGLGIGTAYRYFSHRQEVVAALFEEVTDGLTVDLDCAGGLVERQEFLRTYAKLAGLPVDPVRLAYYDVAWTANVAPLAAQALSQALRRALALGKPDKTAVC